ncbi:cupin domain-containing protein [Paracoccus aestuariivivens]|uniref:Cupin n=1 Tax=Paracoccus aestuariivivens TaxID=1820333 RepID=A0A6L6JEP1_9RHOB|nr:cupin domain-containing protein [Paracoccus aestuariivivens]MTH78391.1 cupin [Paracoccus aestuariivivens]
MARPHALSGEIVSLAPPEAGLSEVKTHALVKTPEFEAIRLFLAAGKELKDHKVDGSITLQCLDGVVDFRFGQQVRRMQAGDWLYLDGGVIHSLWAHEDAALLLTIMLRPPT